MQLSGYLSMANHVFIYQENNQYCFLALAFENNIGGSKFSFTATFGHKPGDVQPKSSAEKSS